MRPATASVKRIISHKSPALRIGSTLVPATTTRNLEDSAQSLEENHFFQTMPYTRIQSVAPAQKPPPVPVSSKDSNS